MLSRTASNLFWIGRYLERAGTTARFLEVGARITLLPNSAQGYMNEWESLLNASGTAAGYTEKYGETREGDIEKYMFFDRDNPSSVASCIASAREAGRIVRTALSRQVWDALNVSYQELRALEGKGKDLSELTDWAVRSVTGVHGAAAATLLRNDGWHFLSLGSALERADATARMLDVKYYVLLPRVEFVGSGLDSYQWQTLLRAMSAQRAFNWAYGGDITAGKVAHFLILNREQPRSLINALSKSTQHLNSLAERYGTGVPTMARDRAQEVLEDLRRQTIDHIFEEGLHEFLTRNINEVAHVSDLVHQDYLGGAV
ncbi:alpha-E domain-containing protein [Paracoccus pacificus]|uniref:Alpha-E domain-containing protein n=1 Tax=Paracoccus pacificus TaxID=1463598 RepID=A0ABW4R318_9RHOB